MRKLILLPLLIAVLALVALPAFAQVGITLQSPADGSIIGSSQIQITYALSGNVASCSMILNGNLRATATSINQNASNNFAQNLADGAYSYRISCTEINSSVSYSDTRSFYVDTQEPVVVLNNPFDGIKQNSSDTYFYYTPSDTNLVNCSLWGNFSVPWARLKTVTTPQNGSINSFYRVISDGVYFWNIECTDIAGRSAFGYRNYLLTIDTQAPSLTKLSPDPVATDQDVQLKVATNENAHCRYASGNETDYRQMADFDITDSTSHTTLLAGLLEGSYEYYVKCADTLGHVSSSLVIPFEVSLAPTAEVHLSYISPLKAGLIEVTLLTSKNLKSIPHLYYAFDDDGTLHPVSLGGSGSLFKGYIIIPDDNRERAGSFSFSGTDLNGRTGTVITYGKVFVTKTTKPMVPSNLRAASKGNGTIRLTWFYDRDDVVYYQIFRSAITGVSYVDYYRSTNYTNYLDSSTTDKVTYYYKIAAVDYAGNLGPLSEEAYATAVYDSSAQPVQKNNSVDDLPRVLPPNLVPMVDDFTATAYSVQMDIDSAVLTLQKATDTAKRTLISDLGIVQQLQNARDTIDAYIKQADDLKLSYKTESQLEMELNKLELKVQEIRLITPRDASITEQAQYLQAVTDEELQTATGYFLKDSNMTEKQKADYINAMKKYVEKLPIDTKISMITVEYLDGTKLKKTLFEKKISYQNSDTIHDVIVIETIPKAIAQTASELDLITEKSEVLVDDPVIRWGFYTLTYSGETIRYSVDKQMMMEDAKAAKTTVLLGPLEVMPEPTQITGFSIGSMISSNFKSINSSLAFILIGALVIAGLSVYYVGISRRKVDGRAEFVESLPATEYRQEYKPESAIIAESKEGDLIYLKYLLAQADAYESLNDKQKMLDTYPKIRKLYEGLPKEMKAEVYDGCLNLLRKLR